MQGMLAGQTWTQQTGLNGWELVAVIVAALCFAAFWVWMLFRG